MPNWAEPNVTSQDIDATNSGQCPDNVNVNISLSWFSILLG